MTASDWTKEDSDKAHAIVARANQELVTLGMTDVGAWRIMLLSSIEHLSRTLEPHELLGDIGKTRRWLDKLEAGAKHG